MDKDTLVLHAARASRVENQDAIDASIVGMLGDPKEVLSFTLIFFYEPWYCLHAKWLNLVNWSLLWHLRQGQDSLRCISCPSILWTSAQLLHTLMVKATGIEAARVPLSK